MVAPGFWRRMAAVLYDSLLLLALLFFATALILPLNSGEAFTSEQAYYPAYLSIVGFLFYGWFWTHGGQTLGLRSWKLKLVTNTHRPLTWKHVLLRFAGACISWLFFGMGFIWILIDKKKLAWHDRLSGTILIICREQ